MSKPISFSPPDIRSEDIEAVVSVLKSGWITSGPVSKSFEERIAHLSDAGGCLTVSSATTGLEAVLRFLGISEGDEVIVPAYTYTASASCVAHVGAKIVLVDSEEGSFTPSIEGILEKVTPATKAVITVDLGGVPFDRSPLITALESNESFVASNDRQAAIGRVAVIDDAAHSLGATVGGKGIADNSDFAVFSFHAVKNLTTAEGGSIVWNATVPFDAQTLYAEVRKDVLHGQSKDALSKMQAGAWEYDITHLGYKANMPDILAALGLSQMNRYKDTLAQREEIVRAYDSGLTHSGLTSLQHFEPGKTSSYHLYVSQLPEPLAGERNAIIEALAKRGIATNVHYKPLPLLTAYKDLGFKISDYPNALKRYERAISLPLHTLLMSDDVERIIHEYGSEIKKRYPGK